MVNLGFVDTNGEWASISGVASVETDRAKVRKYCTPSLRAWLGDLGDGVHDGGPEGPRVGLIRVTSVTIQYAVKSHISIDGAPKAMESSIAGGLPRAMGLRYLTSGRLGAVERIVRGERMKSGVG